MTTALKVSGRGLQRLATNLPHVTLVPAPGASLQREDARSGGLCSSGNRACVFQHGESCKFRLSSFVSRWKRSSHATAIFRQVNKDEPRKHHDALEFPDGRIVLLTQLREGQEATVLQLPAQPASAGEANAQTRIAYVD